MTRYRLTAPAYIGARLCAAGEEFALAEGVRGPYCTQLRQHDKIDVNNHQNRILGQNTDVPLYEMWDETSQKWVTPSGA